jgi:hypothetical protein
LANISLKSKSHREKNDKSVGRSPAIKPYGIFYYNFLLHPTYILHFQVG